MKLKYSQLFIVLCLCAALGSCSSSYKNTYKGNSKLIRGKWQITAVNVDDPAPVFKTIPVFEDATFPCLIGSEWSFDEYFVGTYNVSKNNTGCTAGVRKTNWLILHIDNTNFVQFKRSNPLPGVVYDRFTNYVLGIDALNDHSMTLKYPFYYRGQSTTLHLVFTRVAEKK